MADPETTRSGPDDGPDINPMSRRQSRWFVLFLVAFVVTAVVVASWYLVDTVRDPDNQRRLQQLQEENGPPPSSRETPADTSRPDNEPDTVVTH